MQLVFLADAVSFPYNSGVIVKVSIPKVRPEGWVQE
jgi:hypothetical protein